MDSFPRQWAAFLILALAQLSVIFSITMLSPILPRISDSLKLNSGEITVVATAYGVTFGSLLMASSRIADRFGRRRTLRIGLVVFILGAAAAVSWDRTGGFIAARFVQGAGAALIAPAAMSLLEDVYPDTRQRELRVARWGMIAPAGATAGVVLSGLVAQSVGWQWVFLLPVVAGVVGLSGSGLVPPGRVNRDKDIDFVGATLLTVALGLLTIGLSLIGSASFSMNLVSILICAGLIVFLLFAVQQSKVAEPLVPAHLLTQARWSWPPIQAFIAAMSMAATFYFGSIFLQDVAHLNAAETSLFFLPMAAVQIAVATSVPAIIGRYGAHYVSIAAPAIGTLALIIMAPAFLGEKPWFLLPGTLLLPLATMLGFAAANVTATEGLEGSDFGLASGLVNTAMEIGPALGVAIMASVSSFGSIRHPSVAFLFAALASMVATIFAYINKQKEKDYLNDN